MSGIDRFLGCAGLALCVWWLTAATNLPVWRAWVPGDRSDITVTVFASAWLLSKPRKVP